MSQLFLSAHLVQHGVSFTLQKLLNLMDPISYRMTPLPGNSLIDLVLK
jgi:hypothetical protein